jgi:hypothetical protein
MSGLIPPYPSWHVLDGNGTRWAEEFGRTHIMIERTETEHADQPNSISLAAQSLRR